MRRPLCVGLLGAVLCLPVWAQSDETGVGEVTGYIGAMAGPGTHPAVGLTIAAPVYRYVVPLVEFSYTPLGNRAFRPDLTSMVNRTNLFEFSGGAHIRLPVNRVLAPYLALGAGLVHSSTEVALGRNMGTAREGDNYFAFNVGIGARYYMSRRWGVRPEIKYYRTKRDFARISIGFFYEFP